jgi:hypothetical protein
LLIGAIAYGSACVYLASKQQEFIFNPRVDIRTQPDQAPIHLAYDSVQIPVTPSAASIRGWWIPQDPNRPSPLSQNASQSDVPQRVILYLGGRGSNRSYHLERTRGFHQLGFSVLMVDYRGYGDSDYRRPSEESVYQDALAAWRYLTQVRGVPPDQIWIYGESLGGAIALDLAVRNPNAAGLVLQSTFTSMRAMTDQIPWARFLPVDCLLTQQFDSLAKIKSLQVPVLILHGKADEVVPYQMGQALYRAAPEPKQLFLVPKGTHFQLYQPGPHSYLQAMVNFVMQLEIYQNAGLRALSEGLKPALGDHPRSVGDHRTTTEPLVTGGDSAFAAG